MKGYRGNTSRPREREKDHSAISKERNGSFESRVKHYYMQFGFFLCHASCCNHHSLKIKASVELLKGRKEQPAMENEHNTCFIKS